MRSAYFGPKALKTLERFGDILIPGDGDLPSFSQYGGLEHIDQMVSYAPSDDISDLNMVLTLFAFLPNFVLRFIMSLLSASQERNGPLSSLLRQLNLAIRGLVFACYYAERPGSGYQGKDPVDVIDFSINRVRD